MTKAAADTPTMIAVEALTARLETLDQQAAELAEKEQDLTKQLAECHATGAGDIDALTKQRREVRERRADILEALPLLRDRIAKDRELACVAEAVMRMKGISRAHGSLRQELDADEAKVQKAAAAYRDAVNRVNDRYRSLAVLRAEANALQDRFGVDIPTLAPVVLPAMREGCREAVRTVAGVAFIDHAHVSPATEHCEHHLRTRRTYREIATTPGGAILQAAGLKPWSMLSARQKEIVEGRERDRQAEAVTAARFEGQASRGLQRRSL